MRSSRLARTRDFEYELADESRMRKATMRLDVAVFDLVSRGELDLCNDIHSR